MAQAMTPEQLTEAIRQIAGKLGKIENSMTHMESTVDSLEKEIKDVQKGDELAKLAKRVTDLEKTVKKK